MFEFDDELKREYVSKALGIKEVIMIGIHKTSYKINIKHIKIEILE